MRLRKMWFDIIPDAVVAIYSLRDLKEYLKRTIDTFNGYQVKRIIIRGDEIRLDIEVCFYEQDAFGISGMTTTMRRVFFGYVEDVARNIQVGMYE